MNNKDDFMTISQAAEYLKYCPQTVRNKIKEFGWHTQKLGVTCIRKSDVVQYKILKDINAGTISPWGEIILEPDESMKPIDFINVVNGYIPASKFVKNEKNLNFQKSRYAITNHGRVLNVTQGHILNKDNDVCCTNGYPQVGIFGETVGVHTLTGYFWCDNGKFKDSWHHIDGDKTNNHAENLIAVWSGKEHGRANKLLHDWQKSGSIEDKKKYDEYLDWLREDNKPAEKIRMFVIRNASGYNNYVYLAEELYKKILSGEIDYKEIPTDQVYSIRMDDYQIGKVRANFKKLSGKEQE